MPRCLHRAALLLAAAVAAFTGSFPGRAAEGFDDSVVARIEYPAWFKDSFLNLRDDLGDARDAGKDGLFLFFSTQGCSYCHLFIETSLSDPAIAARLQEHFDTIGLEIFDDAELTDLTGTTTRVKQFALDQGVQFAPTLLFYDGEGRLVLRLTGYYDPARFSRALDYVTGRHYEQEPLRTWLAKQTAPAAEAGASSSRTASSRRRPMRWTVPACPRTGRCSSSSRRPAASAAGGSTRRCSGTLTCARSCRGWRWSGSMPPTPAPRS